MAEAKKVRSSQHYVFEPTCFDVLLPTQNAPAPGTIVRKVQPYGCPKNGTMGHCYVESVAEGEAYAALIAKRGSCVKRPGDKRPMFALVQTASLVPVGRARVKS